MTIPTLLMVLLLLLSKRFSSRRDPPVNFLVSCQTSLFWVWLAELAQILAHLLHFAATCRVRLQSTLGLRNYD